VKAEAIDTQPIVKLRLRNLISKNKEKLKIIEQYKKNMSLIYQNFQEIQEESGVQSL
jgi:coiled-coil domain-containing protein 63/114